MSSNKLNEMNSLIIRERGSRRAIGKGAGSTSVGTHSLAPSISVRDTILERLNTFRRLSSSLFSHVAQLCSPGGLLSSKSQLSTLRRNVMGGLATSTLSLSSLEKDVGAKGGDLSERSLLRIMQRLRDLDAAFESDLVAIDEHEKRAEVIDRLEARLREERLNVVKFAGELRDMEQALQTEIEEAKADVSILASTQTDAVDEEARTRVNISVKDVLDYAEMISSTMTPAPNPASFVPNEIVGLPVPQETDLRKGSLFTPIEGLSSKLDNGEKVESAAPVDLPTLQLPETRRKRARDSGTDTHDNDTTMHFKRQRMESKEYSSGAAENSTAAARSIEERAEKEKEKENAEKVDEEDDEESSDWE